MGRVVAILRRRRLGARLDGLRGVAAGAWSPLVPSSLTCICVLVPQALLRVGEPSYRPIERGASRHTAHVAAWVNLGRTKEICKLARAHLFMNTFLPIL